MNKSIEKLRIKALYDPKKKMAIASTDVVDRHGEVINQDGWDLSNYQANPVLLWAHDNYEPAVGSGNNPRVTQIGADKKALVFEPQFHGLTELSRALNILYNGDETHAPVLNSFSVGFRPTEQDGDTYVKNELLEISGVNVPANPDAQMLAYKTLSDYGDFKRKTMEEIGISVKVLDKISKLEKDVSDLQSAMKSQQLSHSSDEVLKKRQALVRAITKATDIMLESAKHEKQTSDKKILLKTIKRASEILTTSQREQING